MSLEERLRKLAEQDRKAKEGKLSDEERNRRVADYIIQNARAEYDRILDLIDARIKKVNESASDLGKFELERNRPYLKLNNSAAYLLFDQPFVNQPDARLMISFGREPTAFYFDDEFSSAPTPRRYQLQPAVADSFDHIVWVGDLGELKSEQLVEFIIEHLAEYYLANKSG
jgi:hypothetical protein